MRLMVFQKKKLTRNCRRFEMFLLLFEDKSNGNTFEIILSRFLKKTRRMTRWLLQNWFTWKQ